MRRAAVLRFRWAWMLAVALLFAAPVAGCSASAQAPGGAVTVTPRTSVADQPVQIRVAGLAGGQRATVQVSSTDAAGVRWQASALYRADAAGDIDLNSAAVVSGSYGGVSGMGLIWSMQPTGAPPLGAYSWGSAPRTFAVSVTAGGAPVASGEFRRTMSQAPLTRQ